jgi:VWFA-related protein
VRTRDLQVVLNRFASITGGRAFFTEDVSRLDRFFEEILEDLSNQYLVSYSYPDNERDGQWHKIRVEAGNGRHVRARPGYRLMRN